MQLILAHNHTDSLADIIRVAQCTVSSAHGTFYYGLNTPDFCGPIITILRSRNANKRIYKVTASRDDCRMDEDTVFE